MTNESDIDRNVVNDFSSSIFSAVLLPTFEKQQIDQIDNHQVDSIWNFFSNVNISAVLIRRKMPYRVSEHVED